MTLRFLGLIVFAATGLALAAAFLAAAYAAGRKNRRLLARAVAGGAIVAAGYAAMLAAGPVLASPVALAPGAELAFCGFDCHLHVTARAGTGPREVILRFRSDAVAVPERPGRLDVAGYDELGNRYAPLAPIPGTPLLAGETVEHVLSFPDAAGRIDRVAITWRGWGPYLIPGPENPLVQARRMLTIDRHASGEAGS
ncbi:MAG TPA: hypothetical protein VF037_05855 [Gemmatimonadales bacterium]